MEWELTDPEFPGLKLTLIVTTLAEGCGYTANLVAQGAQPGDEMAWCFFPAAPENLQFSFQVQAARFQFNPTAAAALSQVLGSLSAPALRWQQIAYASPDKVDLQDLQDLGDLGSGMLGKAGLVAWVPIKSGVPQAIAVAADEKDDYINRALDPGSVADAAKAFAAGLARSQAMQNRVTVDTPDPYFNAGVSAAAAAVYGLYIENCFAQGGSAWRLKQPGWRMMGGSFSYGWHDLVNTSVAFWQKTQQTDDGNEKGFPVSPDGTMVTDTSRYDGKGALHYQKIAHQPEWYEFQTQFFDEAIRNWRADGDTATEKILLPMLKLQLERCKVCYDPDGDGLYESYNNTWPSDSVGFNGGGTPEESAYVYYASRAAAEMCRRAGDKVGEAQYNAEADKINEAVQRVLWLKDKGQFASYLEQKTNQPVQRVHDDAWIYAEHVPIETGMTTPEQTWQAMYYTDWAMEHYKLPYGGEMRQTSNWVPGQWSIRELYGGDNYAMALGYFLGGQGDEGWEILRGTMLESMYGDTNPKAGYHDVHMATYRSNLISPGGISQPACSIDFSDIISMFGRSVVEGLFGYNPDYPNGVIRLMPAFPSNWDHASIKTPDFSLAYRQTGAQDTWQFTLARPAREQLRLPVRADRVTEVTVNGKEKPWKLESGAGHGILVLDVPSGAQANIVVTLRTRRPEAAPIKVQKQVGEPVLLAATSGYVTRVLDPQGCLNALQTADGKATATCGAVTGHHLVMLQVSSPEQGDVPYDQLVKLDITDPAGDAARTVSLLKEAPADAQWNCVDISSSFNADVRTIFQQKYASPRPATASMRTGYDGWRAWTFTLWQGMETPKIGLENALPGATGPKSLRHETRIVTPQNVTFLAPKPDKNIAFTSLWDNWPHSIDIPVGSKGDSVWLLVAGSTIPVTQGRIANAVLHFHYADGVEEKLELVPPFNFWALCLWGSVDYDYKADGFALPKDPPPQVQLGDNCRAMVYGWKLRPGGVLKSVSLEMLSQEDVIGIMGVSVMNRR